MSGLAARAADRRRFHRTAFDPPIESSVGDTVAQLVALSVGSAVVEHDEPLADLQPVSLGFDWFERIEVEARVLRTNGFGDRLRSALEILVPSGALVRSLALQISTERITRLESLVEASKLINSDIEPDALVESILTVARRQLGVRSGTVYFVDERQGEIWTDVAGDEGPVAIRFPIGRGLAGHVAGSGEALMLEDAPADARFDREVDLVSPERGGSMLSVPVRDREQKLVGVLQFLHQKHRSFRPHDLEFLQAISEHVAIAMRNAELVLDRIEKNRMDTELRLGRSIQARLLPPPPDDWIGVGLAASSVPCYEVGGDYYDFLDLPEGDLGVAIGDVSGKGVAAALIMSSAQAALRIAAPSEPDLALLISRLDALLHRTTPLEKYATFFFARYSRASGVLRYVNAGHNPPLVVTRGNVTRLVATGPPLGILRGSRFREESVLLEPGATLFLYTDGFTEAVDPEGEELGMDRWEALVRGTAGHPVKTVSRLLSESVTRFEDGGQPADDKTLVIFRRGSR